MHCRAHNLEPEREFVFAAPRKWKFDFAFTDQKIAVEVEGGTWKQGRHNRGGGYESDCRKYSHAAILGWRIIRVTTEMVLSGEAVDLTIACIQGRYL